MPEGERPRYVLLTTGYPSSDDLYCNAFIHRRVLEYERAGLDVHVLWLWHPTAEREAYTYEGVSVVKGNAAILAEELAAHAGGWRAGLLHFAEPAMFDLLDRHEPDLPVIVWIHGVETEGWRRRLFNVRGVRPLLGLVRRLPRARRQMAFIRRLYGGGLGRPVDVVFVSAWYRREVAEADAGVAAQRGHVIPNFIDEALFHYERKDPEQARRVLSIRPFTHHKYANDLTVAAILQLAKLPDFDTLSFTVIGAGPLWQETTRPLRDFANVRLEERFLRQAEVAAAHQEHGIFLCPTRLDSQGVSMGEAMASGLVPVTNGITAIPEFLDEASGVLVPAEDAAALARGITDLVAEPERFLQLSASAAARARRQCGRAATIQRELELLGEA